MSLIEEALRRVPEPTREAEEAGSPRAGGASQPTAAGTVHSWPTQPGATSSQPRTSNMTDVLVTIAVAVLGLATVLGVGGLFWISRAMRGDPLAVVSAGLGGSRTPSAAAGQASARLAPTPHRGGTATAQAQAIEPHLEASPPGPESRPAPPMRSPIRPPRGDSRRPTSPFFVLSGVVEGFGKSYAVINGEIVRVGEQVGDATLVEIAQGSVRLQLSDGREIVLRMSR